MTLAQLSRRQLLAGLAAAPFVATRALSRSPSRTYVLVHGAWHGGWCWRKVTPLLTAAGHRVYTPTLTGLGERSHLLTPEVGLETHVKDITALFEYEDLRDTILVGHSYGGMVVAGKAPSLVARLSAVVYLDAFRMLAYCRSNKGKVHFLVVFNLTRFARDKYDHFALRSHLNSLGISLRSATEPIDDTSTGKLMEGVLAAFAPFDNDVRSDRTRARGNAGSPSARTMDISGAAWPPECSARDASELDSGSGTGCDRSPRLQAVRDWHVYETGNSAEGDAVETDQPMSPAAQLSLAIGIRPEAPRIAIRFRSDIWRMRGPSRTLDISQTSLRVRHPETR